MFLWNREVDRSIRVLQRMESVAILPKQEMKVYEVRLEETRAALNAYFAEIMATRERQDQGRLKRQRIGWKRQTHAAIGKPHRTKRPT